MTLSRTSYTLSKGVLASHLLRCSEHVIWAREHRVPLLRMERNPVRKIVGKCEQKSNREQDTNKKTALILSSVPLGSTVSIRNENSRLY